MAHRSGTGLVALCLACVGACAGAPWQARPASTALVPNELSEYPLSIAEPVDLQGAALAPAAAAPHAALAEVFAAHGFHVVSHGPYRGDLEAALHLAPAAEAPGTDSVRVLIDLRSDGFLVDQAWVLAPSAALADPAQARALVEALCSRLASSEGLADFVRNSGTPEQQMFTE